MKEKRKVLFAAFEATPFLKTGGLGDVAGSLPPALCDEETEVRAVLPKVGTLKKEFTEKMQFITAFNVPLGWRNQYCGLFQLVREGHVWYFLDNEYYFDRPAPYGDFDDGERMAFFAKAVCECMAYLPDFFPDVLHCNDWHTAMAPVFLREQYRGLPRYERVRTVFTIHNLKFQGQYDPFILGDVLGLHECEAARNQLIRDGAVNYLAGAVSYADRITTVSPSYADEICTAELGEGLESLFLRRRAVLSGILNGIDVADYDPATDRELTLNYTDVSGKAANKAALQRALGLREEDVPLLVMVSRLTEQKGVDLLCELLAQLPDEGVQLAVLGTGDKNFEKALGEAAVASDGRIEAKLIFSEELSRQMYAGGDMLLMPSRFEPCGLSQMIAMRYGTVPIVRQTGGLADSVEPYNEFTGEGTGFGFARADSADLLEAIRKAVRLYNDKAAWRALAERCMASDFGWERSAAEYRALYGGLFA